MTPRTSLMLAALALPVLLAAPASAQTVDPRWAPYLGCWALQQESTGDGTEDLFAAAARALRRDERRDDVMICVTPSERAVTVAQQTVVNGDTVQNEMVPADGSETRAEEASCTSTRRAEWSDSGRLLFTRGTVNCEGQPERRVSGLSFVTDGPTWVDVQAVEVRDRRQVRVRRYVLAPEQRRAGRAALSPPARRRSRVGRWTR
jgi:hypothetical protein